MLKIIFMLVCAAFCARGAYYGLYVIGEKNIPGGIFMLALCVFAPVLLFVTLYTGFAEM